MGFPWMLSSLSILVFGLCVTANAQNITSPTFGAIGCFLSGDILNVTLAVFSNGSDVVGAELFNTSRHRFRTGDCIFSGNGSDSNPYITRFQLNITSDSPADGSTDCGHVLVANSSPKQYFWYVHAYTFGRDFERVDDSVFRMECAAVALPTNISFVIKVNVSINDNELTENNGVIRMDSETPAGVIQSAFNLGDTFQLKIEFLPSAFNDTDGTSAALRPYGVYCVEFYATPDLASDRRVDLQNALGCPRSDEPFLRPITNFQQTNNPAKFISRTGLITAAAFDKTPAYPYLQNPGRVYFVCVAEICWRQSDTLCQKRCQISSRKKRQAIDDTYTLVTYIDIAERPEVTETKTKAKQSTTLSLGYIIGLTAAGGVILIISTVLIMCLCRRRERVVEKYHRHSNASWSTSTKSSTTRSPSTSRYPNKQNRY